MNRRSQSGLKASFQASACSRPPEPIRRIRMMRHPLPQLLGFGHAPELVEASGTCGVVHRLLTRFRTLKFVPCLGMFIPRNGTTMFMGTLDFLVPRGMQRVLEPLLLHPERSYSLSDLIRAAGGGRGGTQKVVETLLLHPERSYSLSDLIRAAGGGRGGTQKVVETLRRAGIVNDRRAGNQRLFTINTAHPLYPELRSLGMNLRPRRAAPGGSPPRIGPDRDGLRVRFHGDRYGRRDERH